MAYLVGPSLVTATSSLAGPQAGSVLAGVVVLTGGVLLVRQRRTAPGPSHRAARSWAAVPRSRGLARSGLGLLLVANFGLGFAFGSLQVSVTAFAVARGVGEWAGVLYGIISVASLGAGFAYGHAKWRPRPGHLAVTLTLLATSCPGPHRAHTPVALAAYLLLPGFAIAPSLILARAYTELTEVLDGS